MRCVRLLGAENGLSAYVERESNGEKVVINRSEQEARKPAPVGHNLRRPNEEAAALSRGSRTARRPHMDRH